MVLDVSNREVQIIPQVIQESEKSSNTVGEEEEFKQNVELEEESILYETPKLAEDDASAIPVIK